jgi:hypothetical protein
MSLPLNDQSATRANASTATWIGLGIALFAMLVVRQIVSYFWPSPTFTSAVAKEAGMWISAVALLIIIKRGERLPLTSVGLGTSPWWKSILWGLLLTVVCLAVGLALLHLTGYGQGPAAFGKLPLWLLSLIVLRAGVVEEFFYRGYAIERLQAVGLSRFWAVVIPLVIFPSAIGPAVWPIS